MPEMSPFLTRNRALSHFFPFGILHGENDHFDSDFPLSVSRGSRG